MGTGVRRSLVETNPSDEAIQIGPELNPEFDGVRVVIPRDWPVWLNCSILYMGRTVPPQ